MANDITPRRESREQAFILIFEKQFQPDMPIEELTSYAAENGLFNASDYALAILNNLESNKEKIEQLINENLIGWSFDRLSKVTKALLLLAVCEILYSNDVPNAAAVNEAVELAKKFSTEKDGAYINGVLGSVMRKL